MTPARFAYLDHDGTLAFAHRGGSFEGLENSMAAFEHAVSLGYRYLETDAHATSDDVVVAFHDPTLDRVTDRTGKIRELPWSEVGAARIGGTERVPLFEDLLGAWPDVRLNVDLKDDSVVAPFLDLVRRTNCLDRIAVSSFSDRRLRQVRAALGPGLCTSMGPTEVGRLRAAAAGRLLRPLVPSRIPCVQVPVHAGPVEVVNRAFVRTAHELGIQVHVWTINTRVEMERLLDLGVDGLMTDETETLRDVLDERGAWAPSAGHER